MIYYYYLVAIIVLVLDQATKLAVVRFMHLGQSIEIIPDFFYLTSHRNPGAAFGILEGQRVFFIVITIVVVTGIVYFLNKEKEKKLFCFALALLLGGAIGNLIDRVATGEVVDFLDFYFGTYSYPIFNVADMAIVTSVFLIFYDAFILERKRNQSAELKNDETP